LIDLLSGNFESLTFTLFFIERQDRFDIKDRWKVLLSKSTAL